MGVVNPAHRKMRFHDDLEIDHHGGADEWNAVAGSE
jgi:hypothetical protein